MTILLLLILTGIAIFLIATNMHDPLLTRILFSIAVTSIFSAGITLFAENKKISPIIWQILPLLYGVGFFFYLTSDIIGSKYVFYNFFLHVIAFIAYLFIAPYLQIKPSEKEYSNYFRSVLYNIITSHIVGISAFLLGFIALLAVQYLFAIQIYHLKLFEYWFALVFLLITPLYFLFHLPKKADVTVPVFHSNIFESFLLRFIAIPFIIIYFFILYAYTALVLSNFSEWPKGIVSWLVIAFSTFGYLTYIISPAYIKNNAYVGIFYKIFPWVVLPQIGMLFYAIYLRIQQYGFTVNRYFVVAFGIWLLIITLYLLMSRKKALISIPLTLVVITLFISVGPWSAIHISLESQYEKLIHNLKTANILTPTGNIVPADKNLDTDIQNEIISGIQYLCTFEQCKRIIPLFPDAIEKTKETINLHNNSSLATNEISYWSIASTIIESLNISRSFSSDIGALHYATWNEKQGSMFPIPLDGYNYLFELPSPMVLINGETGNIKLTIQGITETFDINPYLRDMEKKYENKNFAAHNDDLKVQIENENYTGIVYFSMISIKNTTSSHKNTTIEMEPSRYESSGYIVIRKK